MGQATPIRPAQRKDKPVCLLPAGGPQRRRQSTWCKALVQVGTIPTHAEFVNADLYEAAHLQHVADRQERSEQARLWAETRRADLLAAGHVCE